MIVEQFLPAFHYGDAIGNSALAFHHYLLSQGITSRLVTLTCDEVLADQAVLFRDYRLEPHSVKILHFAIPSPLTDFFQTVPGKRVMVYHNVTPPRFFVEFSADLVRFTQAGRDHLQRLPGCFDLAVADSSYNAQELQELRFPRVTTFPIMIDLAQYDEPASRPFGNLYRDERKTMIFVGRITPNKKIEDLVKILFFYKKYLSPSIRLIVAGNTRTLPRYFHAVRDLASRFLLTSEDIVFTGHIPFDELLAIYRLADVFVSMSEHEGFCLPLIESLHFGVPVIAYDTGAVAETLGGAGILVREKQSDRLAALAEQVISGDELRASLRRKAGERMERYRRESRPQLLLDMLQSL